MGKGKYYRKKHRISSKITKFILISSYGMCNFLKSDKYCETDGVIFCSAATNRWNGKKTLSMLCGCNLD